MVLDDRWMRDQASMLNEGKLRYFLREEQAALQSFSYDQSHSLMQSLAWVLPEGKAAVDLPSGSGQEKILDALALIAKIWPDGFVNMRELCVGLVWFESPRFFNFSNVLFYGGIFFRPDVLEKSPLEIATLMIHEAAHHVLFLEFLRDPLILDDASRTVYSPLRKTERPIHGVFQSQAALARMILWLHRVLETEDQLSDKQIEGATGLSARYEHDLKLVTESMLKIKYSSHGERIMQDFVFICDHI